MKLVTTSLQNFGKCWKKSVHRNMKTYTEWLKETHPEYNEGFWTNLALTGALAAGAMGSVGCDKSSPQNDAAHKDYQSVMHSKSIQKKPTTKNGTVQKSS